MATELKAIQTIYKGYKFRSRLEARWAVLFDKLDTKWEYEAQGYDLGNGIYYLPDFYLPDYEIWVEVKGGECSPEDLDKMCALRDQSGKDVVLVGQIPEPGGACGEGMTARTMPIYLPDNAQAVAIRRMFDGHEQTVSSDGEIQIKCPDCNDTYVHLGGVTELPDHDDYSGGWGGRGGAVRIPMWCESGHSWVLRFGFHKGNTYVKVEDLANDETDLLLVLAEGSEYQRDEAILAARQARFEHGEKG